MNITQEYRKPTQCAIAGRIAETAASLKGASIERIKPRSDSARRQADMLGGMYKILFPSGAFVVAFGCEILIG